MAEAGVVGETNVRWSKLDARRGCNMAGPIFGDGCAELAETGVPNCTGESVFLAASSRMVSIVSSPGLTELSRGVEEEREETAGRND